MINMANEELAELQLAVNGHLELVRRLKTRAAELRKKIEGLNREYAIAFRTAEKADRQSRAALQRLLTAQLAAKTGRIERRINPAAQTPPISRSNREDQSGNRKAK
jgi:hypothetical protein